MTDVPRIRVTCEETMLQGDYKEISGIIATCSHCGHTVEVFGTSDASYKRAAVTMREECPKEMRNFYEVEEL